MPPDEEEEVSEPVVEENGDGEPQIFKISGNI